jgi:hypothetical protein
MALTQRTYDVIACDAPDCPEFYVPREGEDPPKRWKKVTVREDLTDGADGVDYTVCSLKHVNLVIHQHITIE